MNEKYFSYIMETVRQNLGLEADDTSRDNEINEMERDEILDRVCEWEGLIGYGDTIKSWIEDIWGISLDDIVQQHEEAYKKAVGG